MAKELEYFIAQRTSRTASRGGGGVMLPVATLSVVLSIAVMVITIAVVLGFKKEVHTKLTSLSGQIVLSSVEGGGSASVSAIELTPEANEIALRAASECGVELMRISPIATRPAVVRGSTTVEGVVLKGVDAEYETKMLEEALIAGEIPPFGAANSSRNALISKGLANSTGLKVGDRLELLMSDHDGDMRRDLYKVGGIYTLGLGEGEKAVIVTDIRNVQRINDWSANQISNYEVWISDLSRAPEVADQINHDLLYSESESFESVVAYDVQRLYPSIFDWLAAHDINAAVIIIIMMVVALANIVTALLILVLERTQLIGMLKVLGMSDRAIRKIFLYRVAGITLRGVAYGNGVAIALCALQQQFQLLKLDEAGYILSSVPIDLGLWWLVGLNVGVVGAILLLVIIPTKMVSRVEPSEAIKYN